MVIPTGFVITAAFHLAVGAAGHGRADSVLDGDSLHGRGGRERDGLLILQALVGRRRAIHGVDLEPLRQGAAIMQGCRCPCGPIPTTPFQAHLRNESAKEPSTPTPILPTAKEARGQAASPICSPIAQPTLEARAELSLLELCLARRRKTTVKKRADAQAPAPYTSSHYFWLKLATLPHFQPKITLSYSSS